MPSFFALGGKDKSSTRPRLHSKGRTVADRRASLLEIIGAVFSLVGIIHRMCGKGGNFRSVSCSSLDCLGVLEQKNSPEGHPFRGGVVGFGEIYSAAPGSRRFADWLPTELLT